MERIGEEKMKMTGAEIILACIRRQNIDTVFGYPGGAVIPLYDALYQQKEIHHIRTNHEQGAVHAADGYARASGNPGVCIVTSGPGATNTITGIATAYLDSIPLVVITGQVPQSLLGKDSFQEVDITGITLSITKYNKMVKRVDELQGILEKAFAIACTGRPGPVLIDVPKDVLVAEYEYQEDMIKEKEMKKREEENVDYDLAGKWIQQAQRPVIYAGGGVKKAGAEEELKSFSEKAGIPVVNTLMSLGVIPRNHSYCLGMVGMHGSREANYALNQSDLIIAVGARFSDRVIGKSDSFARNAKIIHIDIDDTEIDKNVSTHSKFIGSLKKHLRNLEDKVSENNYQLWVEDIKKIKNGKKTERPQFHPSYIINQVAKKIDKNSFVVTDVGQHQMWVAQYYPFEDSQQFITSGGLGTMGFGLGALIGAEASKKRSAVLFTGDGSFRMSAMEMLTIKAEHMNPLIVLFNNSTLGMVRQWQTLFTGKRYAETDINDDFDYVLFAQKMGFEAMAVETEAELDKALSSLPIHEKPVFLECRIDKDFGVYPIVPPGKGLTEHIEG